MRYGSAILLHPNPSGDEISSYLGTSAHTFAQSQTPSLYGAFKDAIAQQWIAGTLPFPATAHEPVLWIEKISNSNRATIPTAWDQGAIYGSLEKTGGDAYGAAITGYVKQTAGSGDQVGVHGRARNDVVGGQIFGGWFYADNNDAAPNRVVGLESDVNTGSYDGAWRDIPTAGTVSAIIAATADDPLSRGSYGFQLSKNTGGGFWTGLYMGTDAVIGNNVTNAISDGEAMHIKGGSTTLLRIGGIRLKGGNFRYGFSTQEASLSNNCAILLNDQHRVSWGTSPAAGRHLTTASGADPTLTYTGGSLNLATTASEYRIAGTKVMGVRDTGWAAATGTATKTTFVTSSVTTAQLAERVKALIDAGIAQGWLGA